MTKQAKAQKFALKAIADALDGSDVAAARDSLSQLVGGLPVRLPIDRKEIGNG
jgi:hypothetical protein